MVDSQQADDPDSPYEITVTTEVAEHAIDEAQLKRAIERALRRHDCQAARIGVAVVDDARIAQVNDQFLNRSEPTDVIAFNLNDGDGEEGLDGEIVLSAETAQRESLHRGHSAEAEGVLYAVHGILHLLGMDDRSETHARAMHEEEDAILTELGYGPVYGTGGE